FAGLFVLNKVMRDRAKHQSCDRDFIKDKEARKDDLGAWFFITFAALIWPLTLPNMVRTVVATGLNAHRSQEKQSLPEASRA
ncbi:MAG: hypothetical protein AAFO87_03035, partial [Cyanobacteria bacterium J06607_6]